MKDHAKIPLPFYLLSKSFPRSFLPPTKKPSLICCSKLYFRNRPHQYIYPIPHVLFTVWYRFLSERSCFLSLHLGGDLWWCQPTEYSRSDSMWLLRQGHKKNAASIWGSLPQKLSEPSEHVETKYKCYSWAPSRHKH